MIFYLYPWVIYFCFSKLTYSKIFKVEKLQNINWVFHNTGWWKNVVSHFYFEFSKTLKKNLGKSFESWEVWFLKQKLWCQKVTWIVPKNKSLAFVFLIFGILRNHKRIWSSSKSQGMTFRILTFDKLESHKLWIVWL